MPASPRPTYPLSQPLGLGFPTSEIREVGSNLQRSPWKTPFGRIRSAVLWGAWGLSWLNIQLLISPGVMTLQFVRFSPTWGIGILLGSHQERAGLALRCSYQERPLIRGPAPLRKCIALRGSIISQDVKST